MGRGTYTKTAAVAVIALFAGSMLSMMYFQDLVPSGEIVADRYLADVGENIHFHVINAHPNTVRFLVDFHDTSAPLDLQGSYNFTHAFLFEGIYNLTIIMVSTAGLTQNTNLQVKIQNQQPQVTFDALGERFMDSPLLFNVTNFNVADTSNDLNKLQFQWKFGDGTFQSGVFANHTYKVPGTYPVACYVYDDQGAVGYGSQYVQVQNQPPTANFAASLLTASIDQVITFNASISTDTPSDQKKLSYFWDFGDGFVGEGGITTHAYQRSGSYPVNLTVLDTARGYSSRVIPITILDDAPSLSVNNSDITLLEGDTAQYVASGADASSDFPFLNYSWDFGATSPTATRRLLDDQSIWNEVTVQDPAGLTTSQSVETHVLNTAPSISIDNLTLSATLRLRMTGVPHIDNAVGLRIYINDNEYGMVIIGREPDNPDEQTIDWPINLDLSQDIRFEAFYLNDNGSYPIFENVTDWRDYYEGIPYVDTESLFDYGPANATTGANPFWLSLVFPDGNVATWKYTFIVQQENTWNWTVFPKEALRVFTWTVNGRVFDSGNDALSAKVTYGSSEWNFASPANGSPTVLPFSATFRPIVGNVLNITAWDDDGSSSSSAVQVVDRDGIFILNNLSPRVVISSLTQVNEDSCLSLIANVDDFIYLDEPVDPASLTYTWNFGDGASAQGQTVTHVWQHAGEYLVQVTVSDGQLSSVAFLPITVQDVAPMLYISGIFSLDEDDPSEYQGIFYDTPGDLDSMRLQWDFGDGLFGAGEKVTHAWKEAGLYNMILTAIDNNGVSMSYSAMVSVTETLPTLGMNLLQMQGNEGDRLNLNFTYVDNILDYPTLTFAWTLNGTSYAGVNPDFLAAPGQYIGTLRMIEAGGAEAQVDVVIDILNTPPTAMVTNYFFFASQQPMELAAYGVDSVALGDPVFTFTWIFDHTVIATTGGTSSHITWEPSASNMYSASVVIRDMYGQETSKSFALSVFIDSDGDGIHDELELVNNTLSDNPDSDGDFLTDYYEGYVIHTNSSNPDTDGDGLYDGAGPDGIGEVVLGTNPYNNDTDADGLLDGIEVIGWTITVQHADDTQPHPDHVTSDPKLPDTDGDNLTDYQEKLNGTDPRMQDTDEDGRSDWRESEYGQAADFDGDGVSDGDEEDGYEIIVNGIKDTVYSEMNQKDTDNDGFDDWEERYAGRDGFATDPTLNDTDADGLNDTMESFSRTAVFGKRVSFVGSLTINSFIARFGEQGVRIGDIKVTVGASVGEGGDPADFEATVTYARTAQQIYLGRQNGVRYYFISQNMTDLIGVNEGSGGWYLTIWTSAPSDNPAILDTFEVTAALPLNPTSWDTDSDQIADGVEVYPALNDGYITNPADHDSDGDGWWDHYEIYGRGTNPLVQDTDGDGVLDPSDMAPLGNMYISVQFLGGHWADAYWFSPTLQGVITVFDQVVAAPEKPADSGNEVRRFGFWIFGIFIGFTWYIDTTAWFGQTYKFDVPDYLSAVPLKGELWNIWGAFNIGDPVLSSTFTYGVDFYNSHDHKIWSGSSYIEYRIQAHQMPHVRTVAVYDPEQFVNGRYNALQHYYAIVFSARADYGPFALGINAVVIPVPLFALTELHAVLENAKEDISILEDYDGLQKLDFSGIDRAEGTPSQYLDAVVISHLEEDEEILPWEDYLDADELKILLDLLTLSANESEGYLFETIVTISPSELGLPSDVLKVIPFDGNYLAGDTPGNLPRLWWKAFLDFWVTLGTWIWMGLVALAGLFLAFVGFLIQVGMAILGAIAEAAIALIEFAVKAAVLVFAFIEFALTLIDMMIMWVLLIITFAALTLVMPGSLEVFLFGLYFENREKTNSFKYEESLLWRYNTFLDIPLPVVRSEIWTNGELTSWEESGLVTSETISSDNTGMGGSTLSTSEAKISECSDNAKVATKNIPQTADLNNPPYPGPTLSNLRANPNPAEYATPITISVDIEDDPNNPETGIEEVSIYCEGSWRPMNQVSAQTWQYTWTPINADSILPYTIFARNIVGSASQTSSSVNVFLDSTLNTQVKNSFYAGASYPMLGAAVILGFLAVRAWWGATHLDKNWLTITIWIIAAANLVVSILLLAKNLYNSFQEKDRGQKQELVEASWGAGFIVGSILTAILFIIFGIVGSIGAANNWGSIVTLLKIFVVLGGIVFGGLFLVTKLTELITGWPTSPGFISQLLAKVDLSIFWVVFGILITTAIIVAIGAIGKRDTSSAKMMRNIGFLFILIAVLGIFNYLQYAAPYTPTIFGTVFGSL